MLKRLVITGMVVFGMAASAAGTGKEGKVFDAKALAEAQTKARQEYLSGKSSASGLTEAQKSLALNGLKAVLGVDGAGLDAAMASAKINKTEAALLESLADMAGAVKATNGDSSPEAVSVRNAAAAMSKLISNLSLLPKSTEVESAYKDAESKGFEKEIGTLTLEQFRLANEAVMKMASLGGQVTKFKSAESRKVYTDVANEFDRLTDGRRSPAEALILAVMHVKHVSRDAAMEIIKRLKDCVE